MPGVCSRGMLENTLRILCFFKHILQLLQGEDSIEDFMDHVEGYEKGRVPLLFFLAPPKVRKLVKPKMVVE